MPNEGSTAKNKLHQFLKRRHQFENCSYGKSSLTTQFNNASDSSLNWNELSISSKSYALNTSKIYKKAFLCHSQARQFTIKHQDVPAAKQQSKQKLLNATKSVDNLMNYPHNMNNKWFYPDFQEASKYKKRLSIKQLEENTNFMNSTSPLSQWKKVEKKYRRLQTQQNRLNVTCDHPQTQGSLRPSSKFLEHVINSQNQKNIEICKESFELKLLLKRFKKGRDPSPANNKETEIEKKIVLKKSKSPGVSHQRKTQKGQEKGHMEKDKFAFVTQEQQYEPQQGDKLSKETKKKKSDQAQKQNEQPVILIHKQPLERCIQSFFTPLHQSVKKTSIMDKSKIEVAKRALIRIKTKKFTMRSIERLQKLSRNLFKEKSQRDLYQIDHPQASNQKDKEKHQLKDHSKCKGKGSKKNKENQQVSKKHDKSKDVECEVVPDASKGKEQSLAVRFPGHFKSHNQHQSLPSNLIRQPQLQAQPCDNSSGKLEQLEQKMKKQMDSEGTKTPPLRKISMSSSEVLFDESLTPNKEVQKNNQQGFFNAW